MGEEFGGKIDTCICMAELLCCPPETITTLSLSYTIQDKKLKNTKWSVDLTHPLITDNP